jgi:hypothetical protein
MYKCLKNRAKIFKQILLNEERFSSSLVQRIPIDIENTLIGRDIGCLRETLDGHDSLTPYNDTSLRVLMRMADVLMYRHHFDYYDVSESSGIQKGLFAKQEKIYTRKKQQENQYWVDAPSCFH